MRMPENSLESPGGWGVLSQELAQEDELAQRKPSLIPAAGFHDATVGTTLFPTVTL